MTWICGGGAGGVQLIDCVAEDCGDMDSAGGAFSAGGASGIGVAVKNAYSLERPGRVGVCGATGGFVFAS